MNSDGLLAGRSGSRLASPSGSSAMPDEVTEAIRAILHLHGRLAVDAGTLEDHTDLYEAGLTSYATVNLMLALEEHFEVEFSDQMLRRGAFASIAAIRSGLGQLLGASA
jgi:acyl carrier protein